MKIIFIVVYAYTSATVTSGREVALAPIMTGYIGRHNNQEECEAELMTVFREGSTTGRNQGQFMVSSPRFNGIETLTCMPIVLPE